MQKKSGIQHMMLGRPAISALALMGGLAMVAPAWGQTGATDAAENTAADIIVTGVRGKARSVTDSPTPVDVISGKELAQGGRANLYQDLQMQIPSFNQPAKAGAGTSSAVLTGGLRGLNPDHTLVLVNGLRWHHTALINVGNQVYNGSVPVDLGMIPTTSIERIEVLREGAAAQYGSDAVAGVINVILKDTQGGSISAQYGQNMDRSDGELLIVRGNYGFKYSDTGSLNLYFSAQKQNASDRSYPVAGTVQLYPRLPNGQPDPREATVDRQISKGFGAFPYKQFQIGYNAKDQIGDVEVFSFGTFNRRIQDIIYPPIIPNSAAALPELYPNFAYPVFQIRESDGQIALGARGTLSGWDWSLSTTAGQDNAPQYLYQSLNASLGPTSPTDFYLGTLRSREWVNSLDVTRKYDLPGGGSLQVSFGLQDRLENFRITEGDPASYALGSYVRPTGQAFAGVPLAGGAQYAPGFRPADAGSWNRNVVSGYGELGYEPNDRLFLGVAGRVEHFNDSSGTSVVGKVDGRYKLTDWLSLRGSFGNGFHAPSLVQQHYSNARITPSTAAATLGQVITNQILPVDNPAAIALGARPLRPEKSLDTSVGLTLNPSPDFSLTVDGYIVKVDNRIALSSILQGPAVNAILVANGLSPNLTGQYFTNALDTRTIGADVIATYRRRLGDLGTVRLTAALNLNHTKITRIGANPPELDALGAGYQLVDRVTQGYLTDAIPESKIALGASWNWDKLDFNLQGIRYGKFTAPGVNPSLDRFFPAKWITNVQVQYHITSQVSIAAGADNIFNVYPPANNIPLAQFGYNQYPRFSPFGFTGGSYYGRLQVDF
ncbi:MULTISPECIES: TonB-dependent receptor plug domain-containing protein [unclassified Sphingobium]|uniref:TonB-dependent receptor plug domain-containing protein n=1 Tax=unclassified Sphingobium TaxID=2611147 RepID=UPI0035A5D377